MRAQESRPGWRNEEDQESLRRISRHIFCDLFGEYAKEIEAKYEHLAPQDFFSNRADGYLKRWESYQLKSFPRTSLALLHRRILAGKDVFKNWHGGEEIWKKYGYLTTLPYDFWRFCGDDVFSTLFGDTDDEGQLLKWETKNLPCDPKTSLAQLHERIAKSHNKRRPERLIYYYDADEARLKYGYLRTISWDPTAYREDAGLCALFGDRNKHYPEPYKLPLKHPSPQVPTLSATATSKPRRNHPLIITHTLMTYIRPRTRSQ